MPKFAHEEKTYYDGKVIENFANSIDIFDAVYKSAEYIGKSHNLGEEFAKHVKEAVKDIQIHWVKGQLTDIYTEKHLRWLEKKGITAESLQKTNSSTLKLLQETDARFGPFDSEAIYFPKAYSGRKEITLYNGVEGETVAEYLISIENSRLTFFQVFNSIVIEDGKLEEHLDLCSYNEAIRPQLVFENGQLCFKSYLFESVRGFFTDSSYIDLDDLSELITAADLGLIDFLMYGDPRRIVKCANCGKFSVKDRVPKPGTKTFCSGNNCKDEYHRQKRKEAKYHTEYMRGYREL